MSAGPWLERLGKWRTLLAGWQLGTRVKGDPECDAIRDHREATLMLRVELSAVTALLIKKGVFTVEEFAAQIETEAYLDDQLMMQKFPGWESTDQGLAVVDIEKANQLMRGWKP